MPQPATRGRQEADTISALLAVELGRGHEFWPLRAAPVLPHASSFDVARDRDHEAEEKDARAHLPHDGPQLRPRGLAAIDRRLEPTQELCLVVVAASPFQRRASRDDGRIAKIVFDRQPLFLPFDVIDERVRRRLQPRPPQGVAVGLKVRALKPRPLRFVDVLRCTDSGDNRHEDDSDRPDWFRARPTIRFIASPHAAHRHTSLA